MTDETPVVPASQGGHSSVMGGSTCARRIQCPGSMMLERGAVDIESPAAKQGSVFHDAMEWLLNNEDATAKDVLGMDFGHGDEWKIKAAQIDEKVAPALHAFDQIVTTFDLSDWLIEADLSLEEWVPGAKGRGDVLGLSSDRKTLVVLDWKFGDGILVSPEENYQFAFYGAGALYDPSDEIQRFSADVEKVVMVCVQPTVRQSDVWSFWETDIAWIDSVMTRAREAIKLAHSPNPPFKTGKECGFCKGRIRCPELNGAVTMALNTPPADITAADLGDKLDLCDPLSAWIKAVKERGHTEVARGVSIPGWKLVEGRNTRGWTDEDEAEALLTEKRVKVDERYNKKLVSPAALEKSHPRLYKKPEVQELIKKGKTAARLVSDDHKAPAITDSMDLVAKALPPAPEQ